MRLVKPKIHFDSPEAAQLVTLTGWVSADGTFYGNHPDSERIARRAGCTHLNCERCGAEYEKSWGTVCNGCRDLLNAERHAKRERKPWDGLCMLYSERSDSYFNDLSDAEDSLEEGETLEDLQLVLCKPNRGSKLDVSHFDDDLPEDGDYYDIDADVLAAMELFNEAIDKSKPLSWSPTSIALDTSAITSEA